MKAIDETALAGKSALDVGCGAGLLCEPLARMGAAGDRDLAGGAVALLGDDQFGQALFTAPFPAVPRRRVLGVDIGASPSTGCLGSLAAT
jgi:hypothetical protein